MTTTLEKSATVAAALRKGEMRAKEFSKGPLGQDIMALRIGPIDAKNTKLQGIRLWSGSAEMDITDADRTHRQAVVAVAEPAREVTRSYGVVLRGWDYSQAALRTAANAAFPVTVPGSPRFKIENSVVTRETDPNSYGSRQERAYRVTGTMFSSATEMTLLLGIDESSHFICALPERVTTVDEAHDALRPGEVPEGSLRQGEWFFVPATSDEVDQVYRYIADSSVNRSNNNVSRRWWGGGPRLTQYSMEAGSSHHGLVVTVPKVGKFTIGIVKDRRTGHHNELVLPTWHKVVRNTEIVFREPKTPAERQRTRTWD